MQGGSSGSRAPIRGDLRIAEPMLVLYKTCSRSREQMALSDLDRETLGKRPGFANTNGYFRFELLENLEAEATPQRFLPSL